MDLHSKPPIGISMATHGLRSRAGWWDSFPPLYDHIFPVLCLSQPPLFIACCSHSLAIHLLTTYAWSARCCKLYLLCLMSLCSPVYSYELSVSADHFCCVPSESTSASPCWIPSGLLAYGLQPLPIHYYPHTHYTTPLKSDSLTMLP